MSVNINTLRRMLNNEGINRTGANHLQTVAGAVTIRSHYEAEKVAALLTAKGIEYRSRYIDKATAVPYTLFTIDR